MSAFGVNQYTLPFVMGVLDKEVIVSGDGSEEDPFVYEKVGFRLSDRITTAVDRFVGGVIARLSNAVNTHNTTGYGWGRWLFMHLFVGSVDWSHAIDITGNYDLTFSGTVTHNNLGITFGASGVANTNCDVGNLSGNPQAWNRRAQGFYCRTNNAVAESNLGASVVYPANGYTYFTQLYPRHTDGNAYSDFGGNQKVGVATSLNRVTVATSSSAAFKVQSRTSALDHRMYVNGVQTGATDTTSEIGMGGGVNSVMLRLVSNTRNFCFLFSTKHLNALSVAETSAFNFYVQQLQTGLQRNV